MSRALLGTAISVTAYGPDEQAVQAAVEDAFEKMEGVAAMLDAYDPDSPVTRFNESPLEPFTLPTEAVLIEETVVDLGVTDAFNARLRGVMALYRFGTGGNVPNDWDLAKAIVDVRNVVERNDVFRFRSYVGPEPPGLDYGGAAKGLALDRALEALERSGAVTGALVNSGSTTAVFGEKPSGEPWRIGVEDPRELTTIVAYVEASSGPLVVSTSGDYQQYFEVDGVRYHHILDPNTGLPARGVRSVTVASASHSALEADILSTALFVMGTGPATDYADSEGLALYLVDDEGRALFTPGPQDLAFEETAEPVD